MSLLTEGKILLTESNQMRSLIRTIIRDLIVVFKSEDEGEFYLPEYFEDRDEMIYDIKKFNIPIIIELSLNYGDTLEVDGEYYRNEDIIRIYVTYDPENKKESLYDLIGELNELLAHELTHIVQKYSNTYNLNVVEPEKPLDYYTQEHELEAQVKGFRRLSKLTKRPFELVVRRWFDTHKNLHNLTDDEVNIVIDKILNFRKK